MEPITTTILTALAAGASAAASETATTAIKDLYQGLKKLVERRFAGKPSAQTVLAEHEKQPEVWQKPMEKALSETGADKDEEIARRASELIEELKKAGLGGAIVHGSGAAATGGGVAAGNGGYAAGRDILIGGGKPRDE